MIYCSQPNEWIESMSWKFACMVLLLWWLYATYSITLKQVQVQSFSWHHLCVYFRQPDVQKELNGWGLKFAQALITLQGRQLPRETIYQSNNSSVRPETFIMHLLNDVLISLMWLESRQSSPLPIVLIAILILYAMKMRRELGLLSNKYNTVWIVGTVVVVG